MVEEKEKKLKQKKVTVDGVSYTLQKISPREWSRMRERCKNRNGQLIEETFISEVLEHIVVQPRVTMDDFEEWVDLEDLVDQAISFQSGKVIR